jgi:hypothetical protein
VGWRWRWGGLGLGLRWGGASTLTLWLENQAHTHSSNRTADAEGMSGRYSGMCVLFHTQHTRAHAGTPIRGPPPPKLSTQYRNISSMGRRPT